MSQHVVSQKIKRTCQGCDFEAEYELINASDDTIAEMQNWYTVIREVFDGQGFVKMMVQAHSLDCMRKAAEKMVLPPIENETPIDLTTLRNTEIN